MIRRSRLPDTGQVLSRGMRISTVKDYETIYQKDQRMHSKAAARVMGVKLLMSTDSWIRNSCSVLPRRDPSPAARTPNLRNP
jgi:hypothetical protein